MNLQFYCGRALSESDVESIQWIVKANQDKSRYFISKAVCQAFGWTKADGGLKDMSCRVMLLKMHRDGVIELPAPRQKYHGGQYRIQRTLEAEPEKSERLRIKDFKELNVKLVDGAYDSSLWNEYIDRYHYLGYKALTGAQMRYWIVDGEKRLGCLGFGSGAWRLRPRDEWIGWNDDQRKRNLHYIVNNARFLIFPWIECKNLASKALSMVVKRIVLDWDQRYHYRPYVIETFIENRFVGTCYKASNWTYLGKTQGRGRCDRYNEYKEPIKSIWAYPLSKDFREKLKV